MPEEPGYDPAAWFRAHAVTLGALDGERADLAALDAFVGDARVVALGENAHFVTEFADARASLTRYLAERHGFSVFAFEFGFSEGFAVDTWLREDGDLDGLAEVAPALIRWGAAGLMRRLAAIRRDGHPLRFAGLDLPDAGGALRPALDPVADYLREVDPEALGLLDEIRALGDSFLNGGGSGAGAAPAWARLPKAGRDALTAGLSRLALRFSALAPRYLARADRDAYDLAAHRVAAARHTDAMFRAAHALLSGADTMGELSTREIFLADSVRWHLDHVPGARVVLAAHNNHIQKSAVAFPGGPTVLPMGLHLHEALGEDYRALALTHTADHVPEMYPDADAPVGFTLGIAALDPPPAHSVEGGLTAAGLAGETTFTDLREHPVPAALAAVRSQSASLELAVPLAFDGVLALPSMTGDPTVDLGA